MRQFTDRQDVLGAFEAALAGTALDRHSVLSFYGVGGIGKTSLVQEIRRRLREEQPGVAHAQLDLRSDTNRLPAKALLRLRSALRDGHGVRFPTFDIAFAVHWKLTHPHLPLVKSELPFLVEGEVAGDLLGALADVPGLGLIAKIPRVLDRAGRAARQWWTRRGQEELRHIAALDDPFAVEEFLPAFWGADLRAWLGDDRDRRAVVFLDTFEALWEGRSEARRGSPPDEWVRDWAGHLAGALVVIAGREKLRWAEHDDTWVGSLEQHLVGALAPEDCERFLRGAGVAEHDVRAAIVERSGGLPYYLDLAVDTYEKIKATEGHPPQPDAFEKNLSALLDRFLHYLSLPERAALYVLSVPESFDVEGYEDLMRSFATGQPATTVGLEALQGYSVMEEPEPGRHAVHALVREALAAKHDPKERARVHAHLFERSKGMLATVDPLAISDQQRRALHDGSVHGQAVLEPEAFLQWYWSAEKPFERAADSRQLLPLREAAMAFAERHLGLEHPSTLTSVNNLASVLQARGRLEDAEPLFRQALEERERVLGPEHPDTLTSVSNLAGVLQARGRLEDAEPLYRQALEARERVLGPEHLDTLATINNLALALYDRGRFEEAEPLYWRALEGCEQVLGPEHPGTLSTLNNLAGMLLARKRFEEAEPLGRRALEGFERVLGPDHPDTLTSVNLLAIMLHARGWWATAEPLYRRALEGCEQVLGPQHPNTLMAVNNLADLLYDRGRYEEAEPLHRRALEGFERVLGPDHPDTLTSVSSLARMLVARGWYAEAEALYRRALDARERALGSEHPSTLTSVNNLAFVLEARGRLEEAEPLHRRALDARERAGRGAGDAE